jgi:hypothetical protein
VQPEIHDLVAVEERATLVVGAGGPAGFDEVVDLGGGQRRTSLACSAVIGSSRSRAGSLRTVAIAALHGVSIVTARSG